VDRGALLVGAPGTGKTTLAKAIAKDCGVRFISASAASWQAAGESLGPHISAIRSTFSEARNYAPSILFIDEIDSIGNREDFVGGNNAVYQTEVVNAVIEEMAGLDPAAPVIVIGATNHEERVDPALRRSGRLDRVIRIPRPNSAALDHIYRYYIGALGTGTPLDPALDTGALARLSVGLTGADVERIVRGAARRARKANRALSQIDVLAEITDKPRGPDALRILTPTELARTATHEAGHALALFLSESKGSEIGFVSIVPRDEGVLGFVVPFSDERVHLTRRDLEAKLDGFLAGRAAEELIYGPDQVSGGAERDLQFATELVIRMVTKLGLGGSGRLQWSEAASAADMALVEATLSQSYDRVLDALRKQRPPLEALAQVLVDRQELTGDEVRGLLSRR
jgi:ATP-dependent Zn protease